MLHELNCGIAIYPSKQEGIERNQVLFLQKRKRSTIENT